jgi:hypothetical protein
VIAVSECVLRCLQQVCKVMHIHTCHAHIGCASASTVFGRRQGGSDPSHMCARAVTFLHNHMAHYFHRYLPPCGVMHTGAVLVLGLGLCAHYRNHILLWCVRMDGKSLQDLESGSSQWVTQHALPCTFGWGAAARVPLLCPCCCAARGPQCAVACVGALRRDDAFLL